MADGRHVLLIMKKQRSREGLTNASGLGILLLILCGQSFSQELALVMAPSAAIAPHVEIAPPMVINTFQPKVLTQEPVHKFWDRENKALFAGVAVSDAADFAVTCSNLNRGGKELNPITRVLAGSPATLAVNFAGETAGVVGLSYFFHKSGHHKLERLTSAVNISASAFAVGYGLSHRR